MRGELSGHIMLNSQQHLGDSYIYIFSSSNNATQLLKTKTGSIRVKLFILQALLEEMSQLLFENI